jgi:phosphoglycolate phosphatase
MQLVLFDVDGTLISTRGAGMRAFYRALESLFKVVVDKDVIRPDGMTDPLIVKELLAYYDLTDHCGDDTQKALFACYLDCLEDEMTRARERGAIRILPGVSALLQALSVQPDFAVGLVTGNLERGAQIKLDNAGLSRYFRFGGYGSDSANRTELTKIGIARGAQMIAPEEVKYSYVIGDTPLDIEHGRAAGARVIAVASARYTVRDLACHNPDLLVSDLTGVDSIIDFMRSYGSHRN